MAEERSDHEPPNGGDDEEVAESTIAMGAPTFDPAHMLNVRSPISEPPPPIVVPEKAPVSSPHTAPQDFKVAPAGPAGVPRLGRARAPSSPVLPTPLGGLTPSSGSAVAPPAIARVGQTPTTPGAAPAPAPAPAARPGAPGGPRLRAQTVIGIAPAPPGAPRPVAVRPTGNRPKTDPGPIDAGFGLDAGVAEAARAAALAPGPRPRLRSHPAAELDVPKIESTPPKAGEEGQTMTFAVPRENLPPLASLREGPALFSQDEETQARVQDDRVQDARVVHDDAGGDDATISALPHLNQARNHINPALAQGFLNDGPPPASAPYSQPQPQPPPQQQQQHGHGAHPAQAWNPPPSQPMPMSQPRGAYPSHPGNPPAWNGPPSAQPTGPMQFRGPAGQPMPMQQGGQPGPMQGGQDPKFSTQVAIVAVVGVVCLLVFIFGVVLFLTSNSN